MKRLPALAELSREIMRAAGTSSGNLLWFKTAKGDYAETDQFIGVSVPALRAMTSRYRHLSLIGIEKLLTSPIHEYRYAGLLILVSQYQAGNKGDRQTIFDFYLAHTSSVNNWDLVDTSAAYIVGEHLVHRSRRVLYRLARSQVLWERRIAMVATSAFIERGDLKETFGIAERLLDDHHDLIHKAVGWMLREAGDVSRSEMMSFLKRHYCRLPRTALRYAIEHLPERQRKRSLKGLF
jgi:3-methyladenine DNA glycosylase AlkD